MKRIFSFALAIALLFTLGGSALASPMSPSLLGSIHPEFGELIDYEVTYDAANDVTMTVRTYRRTPEIVPYYGSYETETLTREASFSATGQVYLRCYVTATFTWSENYKTVQVYDAYGEATYNTAEITKEGVTRSGNGTTKASATYSCSRLTSIGGTTSNSVTISCDYRGNNNANA